MVAGASARGATSPALLLSFSALHLEAVGCFFTSKPTVCTNFLPFVANFLPREFCEERFSGRNPLAGFNVDRPLPALSELFNFCECRKLWSSGAAGDLMEPVLLKRGADFFLGTVVGWGFTLFQVG